MDSAGWIVDFLTSPATPLWGTFLVVAVVAWKISVAGLPAIVMAFIERRRAVLAEKAADRDFLRDEVGRMELRCERLEERDDECRRQLAAVRDELADERAERKKLEAIMFGIGEGKQMVQRGLSADRVENGKKGKPDG